MACRIVIYDNNHNLQIFNKNSYTENRCVSINITDLDEYIRIKLRDVSDFVFNYSAHIDLRQFDIMRAEQSLDIDFHEFKTNLIDMLQQVQKHEMFLKCVIDGCDAKLIFYGKSKIKSIVYLSIDLQVTDQKEIFEEMNKNILQLQTINKNLTSQIQTTKKILQEKDIEIDKFISINKQFEKKFLEELQHLSYIFSAKLQECSAKLLNKILTLTHKLLKLIQDVEIIKTDAVLKSDSTTRVLQSMENLRLESIETSKIVDELKRENSMLKSTQLNNEKIIADLKETIQNNDRRYSELHKEKDELEKDIKQAAIIIAQKTTANEELARDVVQANQMLVSFNHLFNTKNNEIEELKNSIGAKDKIIQEQSNKYYELCQQFEEYKIKFNPEQQNKLSQDLFAAHKRVEEVEKHNRETTKLNELLTRKLASGDFTRRNIE